MNSNSINSVAEPSQSATSTEVRMVEAQASTARKSKRIQVPSERSSSTQNDYRKWCDSHFANLPAESRYTVYGQKINSFLREYVIYRICKRKKVTYSAFNGYLRHLITLYNEQRALGVNNYPNPIKMCVVDLKDNWRVTEEIQRRAELQNRGLGTSTHGCTSENLEFERAMEESVNVEVESADLLLRRAIPLAESRIADMQSNTAATLNTVLSQIAILRAQMTDFSSGGLSLQVARINQPDAVPSTRPVQTSYSLSKSLKTIPDVWREWHTGLDGGVSVVEMDLRYDNAWRRNDTTLYLERKKVINAITKYAADHGVSPETAIVTAEVNRRKNDRTIGYLSRNLDEMLPDQ